MVTSEINIGQGILQGDTLSPLLFNLFISDFEEFLRSRGAEGVNIDNATDILVLFYADDMVILGSSQIDLQKKLNLLKTYCETYGLTVNIPKTKIVIFRKAGNISKKYVLYYDGEKLDIVNSFTYLGVTFSSSGLFPVAAKEACVKGKIATAKINEIVRNSKVANLETWKKLFEAVVSATTLYGCEVWAWRYVEELEKVQSQYFKSVLFLPRFTPGYCLRIELDIIKLKLIVFKKMLAWWCKLLKLEDTRYSKVCFNQLVRMQEWTGHDVRYNWATQLQTGLCNLGYNELWNQQDVQLIEGKFSEILDNMSASLRREDMVRVENSTYNSTFKCTIDPSTPLPLYWKAGLPHHCLRFVCQMKVAGENIAIVSYGRLKSTFSAGSNCDLCNTGTLDTLFHFFCYCPVLRGTRLTHLGSQSINFYTFLDWIKFLGREREILDKLVSYYLRAAKERNFIKELHREFDES
ncbi:hypothetical protein WDU94_013947 [Cyamophila willieti]